MAFATYVKGQLRNRCKKNSPQALYYQQILQNLRSIAIRGDALQDLDCTPKFSALPRRHRVRDQRVRQGSLMPFY